MAADTKQVPAVRIQRHGYWLPPTIAELRETLAAQGLHVVTAAEKAVLDACRDWADARGSRREESPCLLQCEDELFAAELARREAGQK